MCPVFNPETGHCRVTPWDSAACKDEGTKRSHCMDSYGHTKCANYEAWQRGDYKIERS